MGRSMATPLCGRSPRTSRSSFLPYSGPDAVDRSKWKGHLAPPDNLHPASVQMEVDVEKFEDVFVRLMSH